MLAPGVVTQVVVDLDDYTSWVPTNLLEHLAWITKQIAMIPLEYQNAATIQYDTTTLYDETMVRVMITYQRPPTKKEISNYETNARCTANRIEVAERIQLAELKAKYES